ncbi:hypothetical protein AcV7_005716 [Taiwanofungus camphoratus]|nr:hypothetical protein AcV7_005716 [Antrodia cinnamomea]
MVTADAQEVRPQAGPVPSKRGEIGYQEGVHEPAQEAEDQAAAEGSNAASLPARHPADRSQTPPPANDSNATTAATSADTTTASTSNTAEEASRTASPSDTASLNSTSKIISFLKPKQVPTYWGLRTTTLVMLLLQFAVLGGTVGGWVEIVKHMPNSSQSSSSSDSSDDNSGASISSGATAIFIYVTFAIIVLMEVVFIERCIFRLRAERYAYLHPGEILPTSRRTQQGRPGMGFVPWNRPSLPTYAAALAQSGVGTGDVEDNIIAQVPPPAYGNTRESTLLLAGPQRTRAVRNSGRSQMSQRMSLANGSRDDRPVSYMSTDPEWEERLDAAVAVRLEESLARMEEGDVTDAIRES